MSARNDPATYDTPEKERYRRDVWVALAGYVDPEEDHVLMLPGPTDAEVRVARRVTLIRPEGIHLAFETPAHAANWTRRYGEDHLGVSTYGTGVEGAVDRIIRNGVRLRAANLDLCGNLNAAATVIPHLGQAEAWADNGIALGVNVLRGREDPAVVALLDLVLMRSFGRGVTGRGDPRPESAQLMFFYHMRGARAILPSSQAWRRANGLYRSEPQTFAWAVMHYGGPCELTPARGRGIINRRAADGRARALAPILDRLRDAGITTGPAIARVLNDMGEPVRGWPGTARWDGAIVRECRQRLRRLRKEGRA